MSVEQSATFGEMLGRYRRDAGLTQEVLAERAGLGVRSIQGLERGESLLERTRLLTLTGPGGTGKTRLAVQLAVGESAAFPDGVAFVPLAAVSDSSLLASTIASVLGIHHGPGQSLLAALMAFAHPKRMLLLLDNFEQIMPAAPPDRVRARPCCYASPVRGCGIRRRVGARPADGLR